MKIKESIVCLAMCISLGLSSCKDKWEEHNAVNDPLLVANLLQQINANGDFSKFSEYLVKTGYDKIIASSKSFTVWAPTNQALQALDPTVINTEDKLKLFVGNHISYQAYLTSDPKPIIRVKSLNGKLIAFTSTSADDSQITKANIYVGNGVLHVLNQAIVPKVNAWEYLMSTSTLQKAELTSLNYNFFNILLAEQTGISPTTGAPIYKPGSGNTVLNTWLEQRSLTGRYTNVINNEDSTYTYIVLTDAAFNAEKAKLQKFYATTSADTTDSLTKFNVIKDLVFSGILNSSSFPADAYSTRDSVRFHLDKNAIVETKRVSNGIVYVMNSLNYDLYSTLTDSYGKLKPVIIQGESLNSVQAAKAYSLQSRLNTFTSKRYTQFFISNHATSALWVRYLVNNVLSTKYQAYWVAVNDFQAAAVTQKLAFKSNLATDFMAYKTVPTTRDPLIIPTADMFNEQALGPYTFTRYYTIANINMKIANPLAMFLVSFNTTANGTNSMVLDYVKLVPTP